LPAVGEAVQPWYDVAVVMLEWGMSCCGVSCAVDHVLHNGEVLAPVLWVAEGQCGDGLCGHAIGSLHQSYGVVVVRCGVLEGGPQACREVSPEVGRERGGCCG